MPISTPTLDLIVEEEHWSIDMKINKTDELRVFEKNVYKHSIRDDKAIGNHYEKVNVLVKWS